VERSQLFQGHLPVEVRLAREVHDGHPATPDFSKDFVPTDRPYDLCHLRPPLRDPSCDQLPVECTTIAEKLKGAGPVSPGPTFGLGSRP
jgi:hypothetical protein